MRTDFKKLYGLLTSEERRGAVVVAVTMVAAAVLQGASVGSFFPFLNLITDEGALESGWIGWLYEALGAPAYNEFLVLLGLGVLALLLLANAMMSVSLWMRLRFQNGVRHNLAVRLLKRYLSRDYSYFLDRNTSELNKNILTEAGQISSGLLGPVLSMFSSASLALAMVGVLLFLEPLGTGLVIGITGGGYALAYLFLRKRLTTLGARYADANTERYKLTAEAFGGIKDVKLLGREQFFVDAFRPSSRTHARAMAKRSVYSTVPKYIIEALAMGSLLAVLVLLLATGQPVSRIVPVMGTFAFAGYRMMPALRDILNAKASFRFTDEIFDTIEKGLEAPDHAGLQRSAEDIEPLPFGTEIHLDDVTFEYPTAEESALEGISVHIPRDHSVGFVGKTGAGKTTLIDVILGLLHPTEGNLKVDGRPVTKENVHRWQANLGYVPQKIFLADTTVRRNIAYGIPEEEIDDDAVRQAAKIAHIHDFITTELGDGYQEEVGEEGVRLSGGQRQRLGIARALYHDPDVLIFDEATSDIDGATEASITEAIERLHGQKTLITIAHRLQTVEDCDRIYVVEDGRIVGEGTYQELLASDERFQELAGDALVEVDR